MDMLNEAINLEKLDQLVLENVMESATISWERTMAISQLEAAGIVYSWVLNVDGSQFVIRKSTRELVSEFAAEMGILDYEMRVFAALYDFDHGIPCVAGEYQLVPTKNKRSKNITWIMAHHVFNYGMCPDDHLLRIMFKSGISIKLDIADSKLKTNINRSRNIGAIQIAEDRQFNIFHGAYEAVKSQWGVPNLDESGHHTSEHNKARVAMAMRQAELKICYKELFGEEISKADSDRCMKAIFKPFHG